MNLDEMRDEAAKILQRRNIDITQVRAAKTPSELIMALQKPIMQLRQAGQRSDQSRMAANDLDQIVDFVKMLKSHIG